MSDPTPVPEQFLDEVCAIVGRSRVLTDPDVVGGYTTDWTGRFVGASPAVIRPADTHEVAAVMQACRRHQVAFVPQGGNTGLVGGSVPLGGEVVLSTDRMQAITDIDPDAGQLTAGAGATLVQVQRAATDAGWRFGVDFAARDSATVGGMIATNAGGVRVFRHGSTRRQVLGVEAVTGAGEVISRLGGLVKDNTGYDLGGLFCGSEGTLGMVCRARLALVPPAADTVVSLVGFTDLDAALVATGHLRRAVPGLEVVEMVLADGAAMVAEVSGVGPVIDPIPPVQLVIEAAGPPDPSESLAAELASLDGVVEVAVAEDHRRARALWHVREAHTESIARLGTPLKFDVTLPAQVLSSFCTSIGARVQELSPSSRVWIFGHVADGNVHVNVTGHDNTASTTGEITQVVLSTVHRAGGSVSAEHGIGTAKADWLLVNRSDGDIATMQGLKHALDPDSICNPGVLLPRG